MASNNTGFLLLAGAGVAAYVTKDKWLPTLQETFPFLRDTFTSGPQPAPGSGATGNNPSGPTNTTGNVPVGAAIPGAVPLGTQGCYTYRTGTDGSMVINCPPGVSPPPTVDAHPNCAEGFTQDAAGICTRYPDAYLLANLNSIPWTGLADIPSEQIMRIDPQILSMYSTTTGVNAGTALAYLLGLGANPQDGTIRAGSDGNAYKALGNVFYRQGSATGSTMNGLGRLGRSISAALPITNATLIAASADPKIAALTGRDQRAMLTADQWNAYYTQATGIVQGVELGPREDPRALMSAEQYQARRRASGLAVGRVGTILPARRGAFPLGAINQWVPPGNRTIFQIPGRGAVPAGRGGRIPPPRHLGLIEDGGGDHRWARSPFPRPSWWREAE